MSESERDGALPPGEPEDGVWPYLGVGCMSAVVGLVAGGMIAVLVAKIVGGITGCSAAAETGAPCDWNVYWTWGARIGVVLVPIIVIRRMRKGRMAARNPERGNGSGTR